MSVSSRSKNNRLALAEGHLMPGSLVGSFFHTFKDGAVDWQGCVVAEPHPGFYLVELFSWMTSASTNQQMVRIEDMLGWHFYDNHDWMQNAYEARWRAKSEAAAKAPKSP